MRNITITPTEISGPGLTLRTETITSVSRKTDKPFLKLGVNFSILLLMVFGLPVGFLFGIMGIIKVTVACVLLATILGALGWWINRTVIMLQTTGGAVCFCDETYFATSKNEERLRDLEQQLLRVVKR